MLTTEKDQDVRHQEKWWENDAGDEDDEDGT